MCRTPVYNYLKPTCHDNYKQLLTKVIHESVYFMLDMEMSVICTDIPFYNDLLIRRLELLLELKSKHIGTPSYLNKIAVPF